MLMPLSIDMYLLALPVISQQFGVPAGSAQMTLSTYILGFAFGQLLYGPMADSLGRKPVILGGTLIFAVAAIACALSKSIDQLIVMRFFHGLAAAAASVVINALMRDIYPKEEFSRMMSFVMLVTTIAPLVAPMAGARCWSGLAGGRFSGSSPQRRFWRRWLSGSLSRKRCPLKSGRRFICARYWVTSPRCSVTNAYFPYMLASGFSFAAMFSFLSAGPFVYIELNHVSPQHFRLLLRAEYRLPVHHDHHQQPHCAPRRGIKHVPCRVIGTVCYGGVDGGVCAAGRGVLVAGAGHCGICRLRVDGFFECDGGHS